MNNNDLNNSNNLTGGNNPKFINTTSSSIPSNNGTNLSNNSSGINNMQNPTDIFNFSPMGQSVDNLKQPSNVIPNNNQVQQNQTDIFNSQPNGYSENNLESPSTIMPNNNQSLNNNPQVLSTNNYNNQTINNANTLNNNGMNQNNINSGFSSVNNNFNSNDVNHQMSVNNYRSSNNLINDNELLKAFVGNNYEKITSKPFNFAGFFFTSFYMFYRKMFLYGLILFVVNLIVLNVINNSNITLAFNVLVGLLVNKIYLYYAKNKIDKIKINNPQKTNSELVQICSIQGGTSVGKVFLGFLVEIIITIIVLIVMAIAGITSIFGDLFSFFGNSISSTLNGKYEGIIITDTSINIKDEFSLSVPSKFKSESDDFSYKYEYERGDGTFSTCGVSLQAVKGFSDGSDLVNQIAQYNSSYNPSAVTNTTINNTAWNWFSVNDAFGTTYYYGTTKDNKAYLLEYEIQEDASSDCQSYKDQVLNSIQSK